MTTRRSAGLVLGAALAFATPACGGSENCDRLEQMCDQCASSSNQVVCETVALDSDEDTCEGYVDAFEKNGC